MKKREINYEFCMKQFRPAIIGMSILLVLVLGWSIIHCTKHPYGIGATLAAANTIKPSAAPINVKAKMLHPYWGNCSKCHQVTGVGKPISNVMTGPPISINDKMLHKYWGNCLLCHVNTDGIPGVKKGQRAANRQAGKPVAFNVLTAQTLGIKVQTVTAAVMKQFALPASSGVLVLEVIPNSVASVSGIKIGDEITRVGKVKVTSVSTLINEINKAKPGSRLKMNIYRRKTSRNIFVRIPKTVPQARINTPMTQNQMETLAEQLGVPKTTQAVTNALKKQQAQNIGQGGVLIAAQPPMTQNQVETMAEQLGVPKTQQAVTNALKKQQAQNNGQGGVLIAAQPPMTQNQVETLAEQLGVPKTQQAVTQALKKQGKAVAVSYYGNLAVASMGSNLNSSIAPQFGSSPYFIVYDPVQNTYKSVANPNANDLFGKGVQTAQFMVDLGVSNVVSGNYNNNALNTLHSLRVNIYSGITGSVRNIIYSYLSGQLIPENSNQMNTLYNNQQNNNYIY